MPLNWNMRQIQAAWGKKEEEEKWLWYRVFWDSFFFLGNSSKVLTMFQEIVGAVGEGPGTIQALGCYSNFIRNKKIKFWDKMSNGRKICEIRQEEGWLENGLDSVCFKQSVRMAWSEREEETKESPLPHQSTNECPGH